MFRMYTYMRKSMCRNEGSRGMIWCECWSRIWADKRAPPANIDTHFFIDNTLHIETIPSSPCSSSNLIRTKLDRRQRANVETSIENHQ